MRGLRLFEFPSGKNFSVFFRRLAGLRVTKGSKRLPLRLCGMGV